MHMKDLQGKTVVVTGAARGLGAAFALAFADAGCDLVLCGRRLADLEDMADIITKRGGTRPLVVVLDLANSDSVSRAVTDISERTSKVDILINNGAMWLESSDTPYAADAVLTTINAAISGTFLFTQGLLPRLESSDRPDVVTIGSISGLPNAALQSVSVPFYAAKRGQTALADGFRQSFAGTKIRSIAVHPPYLDDISPDQDDWQQAAERQKGERGTSRDVVEAVLFAVTRPRHVTLNITIDTDDGGLFPA